MTGGYWILFIAVALISYLVQANLKSKFERFSKIPLPNGMTGRDVAIKMLHDNGIYDVQVISTPGMLTDHYNPMNKTVNLSQGVYGECSIAACCGCRRCSRVRTRSAACPCLCSASHAFCNGSYRAVLFEHCIVGIVGRYVVDEYFFRAALFGNIAFCRDYTVQFHHASCRD